MSLGLLGSYYSSSSESEDDNCDKNEVTQKIEEPEVPESKPKLTNPFLKSASKSLKPSYMVETEDLSATSKEKVRFLINIVLQMGRANKLGVINACLVGEELY